MGFRDDGDATRARADALQRELDDALRELGRLQLSQLETSVEAETLRKRVAELERSRATLPPVRQKSGKSAVLILVLMVVAMGAAVAYLRSSTDHTRAEAERQMAEATARQAELQARREADRRREEEARRAAEPTPAPEAEPAVAPQTPPRPTRHVELSFPAKVKTVTGKALRRGARCTIQAGLDSDGATLDAEVDVTCGDEVLYRWADPLGSGMQMRDCSVGETPGPGGSFLHRLTCSDLGARTGRPQLSLDTEGRSAVVWSEGAPSFRVELTVSGDGRTPGPPLAMQDEGGAAADSFAAVEKVARVASVTGTAPVARGASCRIRVEPRAGGQNCRAELRCGTTALYGNRSSNGFNHCVVEDGSFVRVVDDRTTSQGGDPRLTFDLPARRLVVGDDDPMWEATLTLAR